MICPACAKAADEKWARSRHCLHSFEDHDCTCQHLVEVVIAD